MDIIVFIHYLMRQDKDKAINTVIIT